MEMGRNNIKYLQAEWSVLNANQSADSEKYFNQLITAYSAEGRFYHTTQHLTELLNLLHEYPIVESAAYWAAFYHDYIYVAGNKDNEVLSAKVANTQLEDMRIGSDVIYQTQLLIGATAHHQSTDIEWMDAFLDADMAILGASKDSYKLYSENVRKEYAKVPGFLFNQGRKKFLQKCLDKKRLFLTDWFYRKFEIQAKENIAWELSFL